MFDWFVGSGAKDKNSELIKEYNIIVEELNSKIKENGT